MSSFLYDICIVGGGGHVGFPLGLMFASKNNKTLLYDINNNVLNKIKKGLVPFKEEKAKLYLKKFKKNIFFFYRFRKYSKMQVYNNLYWYSS